MSTTKRTLKRPTAKKVTKNEQDEMKKEFDRIDRDRSGKLDMKEIGAFLERSGMEKCFARLVIKIFDTDGDGVVSFAEFCEYLNVTASLDENPTGIFKLLFDALDTDKDGTITSPQLKEFVACFGVEMNDEEIARTVEHIDADGNGKIDFDEIVRTLHL